MPLLHTRTLSAPGTCCLIPLIDSCLLLLKISQKHSQTCSCSRNAGQPLSACCCLLWPGMPLLRAQACCQQGIFSPGLITFPCCLPASRYLCSCPAGTIFH